MTYFPFVFLGITYDLIAPGCILTSFLLRASSTILLSRPAWVGFGCCNLNFHCTTMECNVIILFHYWICASFKNNIGCSWNFPLEIFHNELKRVWVAQAPFAEEWTVPVCFVDDKCRLISAFLPLAIEKRELHDTFKSIAVRKRKLAFKIVIQNNFSPLFRHFYILYFSFTLYLILCKMLPFFSSYSYGQRIFIKKKKNSSEIVKRKVPEKITFRCISNKLWKRQILHLW